MRMLGMATALWLQATGSSATPQPATLEPEWARKPDASAIGSVYPKDALKDGLGGRATILCSVTPEGDLSVCTVDSESPPGSGFGEAALKLAPAFKMKPRRVDGSAVAGGSVRIPIRFVAPSRVNPLDVFVDCHGETSAKVARDPGHKDAIAAMDFFAAQAAFRFARDGGAPDILDRALRQAREGAVRLHEAGGGEKAFKSCMSFFRRVPPQAKSPQP
jgi:TonB family protein